jgi:hypothetical protein
MGGTLSGSGGDHSRGGLQSGDHCPEGGGDHCRGDQCRIPQALHVDASRLFGLVFILKQEDADGNWRMVQAGSRYLSDVESRYSMIKLECLHKWLQFINGLPHFDLFTDHRPLIPILNDYSLDKLDNPRILHLRLKMQ